MTLIWPILVKFHKVSWKALYDTICVSYKLSSYDVPFSEILVEKYHKGPNWNFLALKMTFKLIPYLSYFRDRIGFTTKKLHDAINLGSTSLPWLGFPLFGCLCVHLFTCDQWAMCVGQRTARGRLGYSTRLLVSVFGPISHPVVKSVVKCMVITRLSKWFGIELYCVSTNRVFWSGSYRVVT